MKSVSTLIVTVKLMGILKRNVGGRGGIQSLQCSSPSPSIDQFFSVLYGEMPEDLYLVFWRKSNRCSQFVSIAGLEGVIATHLKNRQIADLYFSVGLQRSPDNGKAGRGVATDIVAIPGLWLDLDCKEGSHSQVNLPSKEEALNFLTEMPLQPSILVDSGGGLHVYWLFKEPWVLNRSSDWESAAQLSLDFQRTVQGWGNRRGWQFDMTADLSRVLRVPGTLNAKSTPEKEVEIVKLDSRVRYNPSDFEPYLMPSEAKIGIRMKNPSLPKPMFANLSVEPILEGCKWFRHCVDDAPTLPEPEWFIMLIILAKLQNGNSLAHQYSKPYSDYSMSETEAKFAHAGAFNGTHSCSKIGLISGGKHCASCQFQGQIRTPLSLSQQAASLAELAELKDLLHRDGDIIVQEKRETDQRPDV